MSVSVSTAAHAAAPIGQRSVPLRRGGVLLVGSVLAAGVGLVLGDPTSLLARDPELGLLLRAMALIKAVLVAVAMAAIVWRLRRPASTPVTLAYVAGAWAMSFATALIWQLTVIPGAALLFHVGEIGLLLLAWRDGLWLPAPRPRRRA
jgi:hypothetical protein